MPSHIHILRHKKENLKKCSLRGLEDRAGISFYPYPVKQSLDLPPCIVLTLDAPILSPEDSQYPLLLIDATWRYASKMLGYVQQQAFLELHYRSLPNTFKTAYPRRQDDCPDPSVGLASIEALFIALSIMGGDTLGLLDHYPFAEAFLTLNQEAFKSFYSHA